MAATEGKVSMRKRRPRLDPLLLDHGREEFAHENVCGDDVDAQQPTESHVRILQKTHVASDPGIADLYAQNMKLLREHSCPSSVRTITEGSPSSERICMAIWPTSAAEETSHLKYLTPSVGGKWA